MPVDLAQVRKPLKKIRRLLKKMPHAASIKQVHDLRTNARRRLGKLQQQLRPDGEHAAAAALRLEHALRDVKLGRQNLHPFRLEVKELRNTLRLAEQPDEKLISALGEVKDAIGEWHDWEELACIACDVLDHGPQCELVREVKRRSRQRYDAALQLAKALQRTQLRHAPLPDQLS